MSGFRVRVLEFTELAEIEGSWTPEDFLSLLERADFGDTTGLGPDELRDLCVLSLQDKEPDDAAALLLEHRLGDTLSKGQIQNTSQEMLDEKLWEEYADMTLHERFFHVGSLLYRAFPHVVPVPDAVDVQLEIEALEPDTARVLARPLHESLLVRLLADGMPDSAPLRRLFPEPLRGRPFPEAESIVWIVTSEPADARTVRLQVIGSGYWLDALRGTRSYESSARADPRDG